jgi:hypothetical protein
MRHKLIKIVPEGYILMIVNYGQYFGIRYGGYHIIVSILSSLCSRLPYLFKKHLEVCLLALPKGKRLGCMPSSVQDLDLGIKWLNLEPMCG